MDWIAGLFDFILHIDVHLKELIDQYGGWTYGILFLIVFLETGLVFTPLLPGDSLLFASGMFAAQGVLDPHLLFVLLTTAAILGDTVNYWIGKHFGQWLLRRHSRIFKPAYLEKTHAYFEKYGGATIIIARFVPIVRTFAPFVAGMGAMTYAKFVFYNVFGAVIWVSLCVYAGYFLGNVPWIKQNFEKVILLIILLSIMPGVIGLIRSRRASRGFPVQAAKSSIEN